MLKKKGTALGAIFLLRKDIGVAGGWRGPENGNFPFLHVVKMSLRRWVCGSKKHQHTLTQYKDDPLPKLKIDEKTCATSGG